MGNQTYKKLDKLFCYDCKYGVYVSSRWHDKQPFKAIIPCSGCVEGSRWISANNFDCPRCELYKSAAMLIDALEDVDSSEERIFRRKEELKLNMGGGI